MTTLYLRASPQQARVLRIIEGAIKNAANAHDEIKVSPRHRRSIAKRAAGTLTAQWPEVLAATHSQRGPNPGKDRSSESVRRRGLRSPRAKAMARFTEAVAAGYRLSKSSEAGADGLTPLPLLGAAELALNVCAGPIRQSGDAELYDAVIAVLRIMGRRRKFDGEAAIAGALATLDAGQEHRRPKESGQ